MALTQLKTGAIADDAVTTDKLANAINTERTANTAKVSTTINNNADNRVITGSGTANTLNGESTLTYSGDTLLSTNSNFVIKSIDTNASNAENYIQFNAGYITYDSDSSNSTGYSGHYFQADGAEKLRINGSGQLIFDADTNTYIARPAADTLAVTTGGTERLRILAGGGLTFNGDTAAANALDDYEEGTWTPVWSDASSGGTTAAISQAHARYTKIGRVVHLHFYTWSIASQGTSNAIYLQGLPFAVSPNMSFVGAVGGRYYNEGDDNQYNLLIRVNANNSYGNLEWAESHSGDAVAATFGGFINQYTNFTGYVAYLTDS